MNTASTAFAKWTVTANRGEQSAEFEVYGYGRADAVKQARRRVAEEMPFYKTAFDAPGRVTYRAERTPA